MRALEFEGDTKYVKGYDSTKKAQLIHITPNELCVMKKKEFPI